MLLLHAFTRACAKAATTGAPAGGHYNAGAASGAQWPRATLNYSYTTEGRTGCQGHRRTHRGIERGTNGDWRAHRGSKRPGAPEDTRGRRNWRAHGGSKTRGTGGRTRGGRKAGRIQHYHHHLSQHFGFCACVAQVPIESRVMVMHGSVSCAPVCCCLMCLVLAVVASGTTIITHTHTPRAAAPRAVVLHSTALYCARHRELVDTPNPPISELQKMDFLASVVLGPLK